MNLDRYFSVPLFREGLRRLALPAAGLGLIALFVNSLLLFFHLSKRLSLDGGFNDYPHGLELCPALLPYMMVVPLLLALWQFHVLNRQDSVDFFLAAPATRAGLFNAFSLAGLVSQWLTVAVVVVAGALLYHGYGVRLHAADVLHAILTCGVGAFLGWATTACAAAVCTGPLATAALAAIMCFVPGLLKYAIGLLLEKASWYTFATPWALSIHNHLYFDVFNGGFCGAGTLAYTLALAAGYYLLGVYAFARRHAESVGRPGVVYPALATAALFLSLLAFVLLLWGACVWLDWKTGKVSWELRKSDEFAWMCGMILLGFYALAYGLFRRWRPLLFLTLLLPLALAIAGLVAEGGMAWGERFRKAAPAADEVAAVAFLPSSVRSRWVDNDDLAGLRTADPRVRRRAATTLVDVWQNHNYNWRNIEGPYTVRLELRDGACLTRRFTFVRPDKEPALREWLMADPANAAYWRLPGAGQVRRFALEIAPHQESDPALRGDAPQWEAYRQEYAAALASAPAAVAHRQYAGAEWPRVVANLRDGRRRFYIKDLPIIPRLMPRTGRWLRETANCHLPIGPATAKGRVDWLEFSDLDSFDAKGAYEKVYEDYRSRVGDARRLLASLQARQVAPGETAKYHLVHCKLPAPDEGFAENAQGLTEENGYKVRNYFLFMTPEEIAKLRGVLGKE